MMASQTQCPHCGFLKVLLEDTRDRTNKGAGGGWVAAIFFLMVGAGGVLKITGGHASVTEWLITIFFGGFGLLVAVALVAGYLHSLNAPPIYRYRCFTCGKEWWPQVGS